MLRQFLEMRPPKFRGVGKFEVAEEWLTEINKIFGVLHYNGHQKVKLASFQLEAAAQHWRNTVEAIHLDRQLGWEEF